MRGGYDQLQGCTLTQGKTHVTSGTFSDINVIECYDDGDITITWFDDTTQTISLTSGWVNPIVCKSVTIVSGIWNIGKE